MGVPLTLTLTLVDTNNSCADLSGYAIFTTIFPACYSGRMPHIHCEA